MSKLEIQYLALDDVRARARNPRTHSAKQVQQIARSIETFGFVSPILLDADRQIIAGHGRLLAARHLGMATVPTVCLAHMSPDDVRAYVIADNRLAENAGWDRELLALEFKYLPDLEISIDLSLTGFELPEIDILIGELASGSASDRDAESVIPPLPPNDNIATMPGDVWIIGQHRLICGDATSPQTFMRLLGNAKAQMVFSDPPYNVPVAGHVCGGGSIKHREFAMASGEMQPEQFVEFLRKSFSLLVQHSVDGSIHFQCMDWRHIGEILRASEGAYTELKNLCIWAKTNGGMGSLYRSQHELIFVFKSGRGKHKNNIELGRHGRNRTNVWTYPGVNTWGSDRSNLALHPTVKPLELVADAILDCSTRKAIVLDPFAGSGTTLLAAQKTGRRGFGIEIDPAYCDVVIERMRTTFGLDARHEATGLSPDELRTRRASSAAPDWEMQTEAA